MIKKKKKSLSRIKAKYKIADQFTAFTNIAGLVQSI